MKHSKRTHYRSGPPPIPTCENCIHTFRNKGQQDTVVCVPHLKTMPAGNAEVCNLHSLRAGRA